MHNSSVKRHRNGHGLWYQIISNNNIVSSLDYGWRLLVYAYNHMARTWVKDLSFIYIQVLHFVFGHVVNVLCLWESTSLASNDALHKA